MHHSGFHRMPSSLGPAAANNKTAAEDALLEVKAPSAVGSAVASRVASAVGSRIGPPKPSIEDLVREHQWGSEYTSHYKPVDPRASKNMQAAGRDVLKMAIYGEMACKREAKPASMVSACTLASKASATQPPPLRKNRSAPSLSKADATRPLANYSPEDQEGSVVGWRGLTISGYRGPRAPVIPRSEMMRPGNDLYRSFNTEYGQSFHGRMPQGPGRAGNSSVTNPLTSDELENWQQALEEERRRLEKDRAAIEQQQDLLAEQRARMKDSLGFSGAN